jgi:hypothetical protein
MISPERLIRPKPDPAKRLLLAGAGAYRAGNGSALPAVEGV